jgi:hypothetical protein
MKKKLIMRLFQWCLMELRKDKTEDVRVVLDNPPGSITFQGYFKRRA